MEEVRRSRLVIFPIIISVIVTAGILFWIAVNLGVQKQTTARRAEISDLMDRYDMYMTNAVSSALDGVMSIKKVYWLSDADITAPEPNQELFGSAQPSDMAAVLADAGKILNGQSTLFNTETQTFNGTDARYYLDDTIFAVTWKQLFDHVVYTISEVKISHPSQFRRFLAGGAFGSGNQYMTTDMAASVNAVVASSGDFYKFRPFGIVVYNGELYRFEGRSLDNCFIDEKGDMHFVRQGELADENAAKEYVTNNNIRFSLAFGPVLIKDSEISLPGYYMLGEVNQNYARAAIAQMDELHYLLITANSEGGNSLVPTIANFAARLQTFGCKQAYALDGGQTAAIVMNDVLINNVVFGYQRLVSDIIYFATALPSGVSQ